MLRENHKITSTNKNHPTISLNDVVLIERKPRSPWKMGIVLEVVKGKDGNIRGTIVRVPKSNSLITRPICKLWHIESLRECSDETRRLRFIKRTEYEFSVPRVFYFYHLSMVYLTVQEKLSQRTHICYTFTLVSNRSEKLSTKEVTF